MVGLLTRFDIPLFSLSSETIDQGRESITYCDVPKFSDRQVWANSLDPDQTAPRGNGIEEQSDQGLHCLPFCLHLLEALFYTKATLFDFRVITAKIFWCPNFEELVR